MLVKRYVFAPVKPCFAYTLEEEPYRCKMTQALDGICRFMLLGLVRSITYHHRYEEGRVHCMHLRWCLSFHPEMTQRQQDYGVSLFYRKLGWLETMFLQNSWRLFDMDDPDEAKALGQIASQTCITSV